MSLVGDNQCVRMAQDRGIDAPGGRPYNHRIASLLTTASIIASGRPRRIGAHLIRRQLYKQTSRIIRKIK